MNFRMGLVHRTSAPRVWRGPKGLVSRGRLHLVTTAMGMVELRFKAREPNRAEGLQWVDDDGQENEQMRVL